MVGFLDALCGPSASQLKVKDMDKYAFDPKRLLVQITTIVLRVWKQDQPAAGSGGVSVGGAAAAGKESFTVSMATHPDYSQATMTKCGSVLQKQMLGDPTFLKDFSNFVQQVNSFSISAITISIISVLLQCRREYLVKVVSHLTSML